MYWMETFVMGSIYCLFFICAYMWMLSPAFKRFWELWYVKVKKYVTISLGQVFIFCQYFRLILPLGGRGIGQFFPKHVLLSYITWRIRIFIVIHSMIDLNLFCITSNLQCSTWRCNMTHDSLKLNKICLWNTNVPIMTFVLTSLSCT